MTSNSRWKLAATVAAGGIGEFLRRRSARKAPSPSSMTLPPPPPMTTQSSPGQIADLQEAYGAEMAPSAESPMAGGTDHH